MNNKYFILLFLLITGYLRVATIQLNAQNVYIDPTYTGTSNGSIESPYTSFSDFSFQEGYTYLIKRGTVLTSAFHISGVNNITVDAYGNGERPIISNAFIIIGDEDTLSPNITNIKISNIEVYITSQIYLMEVNCVNSSTIDNCVLHGSFSGIGIRYCNDVTFSNCEVFNIEDDGFVMHSSDKILFENTYIHDINLGYIYGNFNAGGDGLQYWNCGEIAFKGCYIDRSNSGNKFGIIANCKKTIIEGCMFTGPNAYVYNENEPDYRGAATHISATDSVIFRYNFFEDASGAIIHRGGFHLGYYNIFADIYEGYAAATLDSCFNNTHYNNNKEYGLGYIYNCLFYLVDSTNEGIDFKRTRVNNMQNKQSSGDEGEEYFIGEPNFKDAEHFNFGMGSDSPGIDAGLEHNITRDFWGNPIVGKPDIGAIENGGISPSRPVAIINNIPIAAPLDTTIQLSAKDSYSPDNRDLKYYWTIGKGITYDTRNNENIMITIPPDYTVSYHNDIDFFPVSLTVYDGYWYSKEIHYRVKIGPYQGPGDVPSDSKLTIKPNPCDNFIYVSADNNENEKVTISIYNTNGKMLIYKDDVGTNLNNYEIDISALHEGLYILKVSIGSEDSAKKFLKL